MSALGGISASQSLAARSGDRKVGTFASLVGCAVTRVGAPLLCFPCVNSPAAIHVAFYSLLVLSVMVFPTDATAKCLKKTFA